MKDKKILRKDMMNLRDSLVEDEKQKYDSIIYEKVINHKRFKEAENIFLFVSYKSEINTKGIIRNALENNKNVFVPKVNGKVMDLYKINSLDDLEIGFMGILEPKKDCEKFDDHDLHFILMPGLAFDNEGGRIGYGGGYYDKFLSSLDDHSKIPKVAIAYDFQIISKIPMTKLDIRVDEIITN